MSNPNTMTVQDVADFFGIKKEDAHKLITQEKTGVKYMWSPVGIIVSRKQFEDIWGKPQEEETQETKKEGAAADALPNLPGKADTPSELAKSMLYRNALTMLEYSGSGKNAGYVREAVKFLEMLADEPQTDAPLIEIKSISAQPACPTGRKAEPIDPHTNSNALPNDEEKQKITEYLKGKGTAVPKDIFINVLDGNEEEYGKNHQMARVICNLLRELGYTKDKKSSFIPVNGEKSSQFVWRKGAKSE